MSIISFWRGRMSGIHNGVVATNAAIEREDYDWAKLCIDGAIKTLEKARQETLNEIDRRNSGKDRSDDADVEDGRNW